MGAMVRRTVHNGGDVTSTVEVTVQRRFVISLSENEARYLYSVAQREKEDCKRVGAYDLSGIREALAPHLFDDDRVGG